MVEAVITLVLSEKFVGEPIPYTKVYRVEFETEKDFDTWYGGLAFTETGILNWERLHA